MVLLPPIINKHEINNTSPNEARFDWKAPGMLRNHFEQLITSDCRRSAAVQYLQRSL